MSDEKRGASVARTIQGTPITTMELLWDLGKLTSELARDAEQNNDEGRMRRFDALCDRIDRALRDR